MTPKISINVKTDYLSEQSVPEEDQYVFSYTIAITNRGEEGTQLLSRYWHIIDTNDQVQEVQGVGVVGEQPHLKPGETFTYSSGTVLQTACGTMSGKYFLRSDSEESYEVDIPAFALVQPRALH